MCQVHAAHAHSLLARHAKNQLSRCAPPRALAHHYPQLAPPPCAGPATIQGSTQAACSPPAALHAAPPATPCMLPAERRAHTPCTPCRHAVPWPPPPRRRAAPRTAGAAPAGPLPPTVHPTHPSTSPPRSLARRVSTAQLPAAQTRVRARSQRQPTPTNTLLPLLAAFEPCGTLSPGLLMARSLQYRACKAQPSTAPALHDINLPAGPEAPHTFEGY
jgi:hypothetical protein